MAEDQAAQPQRLKDAVRQARIETAERSSVVVDLRDAEVARLELLNEELDPVFAELPPQVELFDRGISKGEVPRLWIDIVTYVVMGRDKRVYRFMQDTRYGRKILAETAEIKEAADAVTRYIAGRLIERERALATDLDFAAREARYGRSSRPRRLGKWAAFLLGLIAGAAALIVIVAAMLWRLNSG